MSTPFQLCLCFLGLLFSCGPASVPEKLRYYYLSSKHAQPGYDTLYLDAPNKKEINHLQLIHTSEFMDHGPFLVSIKKYTNPHSPTDGRSIYYYAEPFGIFYQKNITRRNYQKLGCNNDSINDAIQKLYAYILTDPDLMMAGEEVRIPKDDPFKVLPSSAH